VSLSGQVGEAQWLATIATALLFEAHSPYNNSSVAIVH
jgi:hypothetical protein